MNPNNDLHIQLQGHCGNFFLDIDVKTSLQGVTVIYGPSASGKTTLLRAIAGLDHFTGMVKIGSQLWQHGNVFLPVYRRPIGYIFQQASLLPHLNVKQNLLYGMKNIRKAPSFCYEEVIHDLKIQHLEHSSVRYLSGGEAQRVALGRALLSQPDILLLDEPLSALDIDAREELMILLKKIKTQWHLPMIYITHDWNEVEHLADRIILLDKGTVRFCQSMQQLQRDPALSLRLSAGSRRDIAVILEARLHEHGAIKEEDGRKLNFCQELSTYAVGETLFYFPKSSLFQEEAATDAVRIRIAARDVSISLEKPGLNSGLNHFFGKIIASRWINSSEILLTLALELPNKAQDNQIHIPAVISHYSWNRLGLKDQMHVHLAIHNIMLFSSRALSEGCYL